MDKVESFNYTETSILIDAMKNYVNKDKPGKFAIELLLKLERNKGVLHREIPKELDSDTQ